jgi:hypothetical protein
MEGGSERIICISSNATQAPFVIVQRRTDVPREIALTKDDGEAESAIVNVPLCKLHSPVPTVGEAAESVIVSEQIVKSGPALGVIGFLSTKIFNVSIEAGQIPLLTVHTMVFAPGLKLLTVEFGSLISPNTMTELDDQTPDPFVGISASRNPLVLHKLVSIPAFAMDGGSWLITLTVSRVGGQFPVVTVQTKALVPDPNPLMFETGDVGSSKIPVPENKVHNPVPGVGSVALNETESLLQMLISEPAFA